MIITISPEEIPSHTKLRESTVVLELDEDRKGFRILKHRNMPIIPGKHYHMSALKNILIPPKVPECIKLKLDIS